MKDYPYRMPTVHPGFEETQAFVDDLMTRLSELLPVSVQFGGLDFSNSRVIVAVNVEVINPDGKFLALKRSPVNGTYVDKFNNVAGFMIGSGNGRILDCMFGELREEIGLELPFSADIRIGEVITVIRPDGVEVNIIPGQVLLHEHHEPVLNNEHIEHRWIDECEQIGLDIVPGALRVREYWIANPFPAVTQAIATQL